MQGKERSITYTLDWLSVTADRAFYHDDMTMYYVERERGMRGYTIVVEFEDGRLEMLNPDRKDMGVHVEYSGGALDTIEREYGVPKMEVLALGGDDARVSRLDIAVDVRNYGLAVPTLVNAIKYGKMRSAAKQSIEIKAVGQAGHTLYIGSPSSPARLRIYDKAAEQKQEGDWTRVELQLRSVKARHARQQLLSAENTSPCLTGIINRFAAFDIPIWKEIMSSNIEPSPLPENAIAATEQWLLTTVAKTLAKMMAREGGKALFQRFCASVDGYAIEAQKRRQWRK